MRVTNGPFASAIAALVLGGFSVGHGHARPFRPGQMPNGSVVGCAACHVNPGGGGTRTPFGQAVFAIVGGPSSIPFWSPTLAAQDSDGDGLTNGEELGDPDGNGTPTAGSPVYNPGNRPPVFTSSPVTNASMGLAYQYSATAADNEANTINFAKVSGPAWLTVSSSGQVSGTPPDGSAGPVEIQIQVRDLATATRGNSRQTNFQAFTIETVSSLAGWQQLNFNLPSEAALAEPQADPDGDALPNLVEYALRLNPRASSVFEPAPPGFDDEQRLQIPIAIRDDDPRLSAQMEVSDLVTFPAPTVIATTNIAAATPGPGFKTLLFTDTVAQTNTAARFGKIRLEILP